MVCIYCRAKTAVVNSRSRKRTNETWRRRQCAKCQNVMTTLESVDFTKAVLVNNVNGNMEPFQRDLLFVSIYESLKHRKDAPRVATALTDTILGKLLPIITNASLKREDIVSEATVALRRFDRAAGVHYAAYHHI